MVLMPADAMDPADMADLTTIVLHDVNNFLNEVSLQFALLEQEGSSPPREELAQIRNRGKQTAHLVRQLQGYCQAGGRAGPADMNASVRNAAERESREIRLELDPGLPPVHLELAAWDRILAKLLRFSLHVSPRGSVRLQTRRMNGKAQVCLEDGGPQVPAECMERLFEPFLAARPGTDPLTLAICKAALRRMQGTIQGENRPEGGMRFVLEFRIAESKE